jgi:hypothetical protein
MTLDYLDPLGAILIKDPPPTPMFQCEGCGTLSDGPAICSGCGDPMTPIGDTDV